MQTVAATAPSNGKGLARLFAQVDNHLPTVRIGGSLFGKRARPASEQRVGMS
jgi:hypothetical protein